jgi:hypothetical protein
MSTSSDLQLLQIEMDLLWSGGGPELVIAASRAGLHARVGDTVPEHLARKLRSQVESVQLKGTNVSEPPPELEAWRTELEGALGAAIALAAGSGPSYHVHVKVDFPSSAPLVRSDAADAGDLRDANPGNWQRDEWQDLLDGRLGPWVMGPTW